MTVAAQTVDGMYLAILIAALVLLACVFKYVAWAESDDERRSERLVQRNLDRIPEHS